jgi:hypothetical protein
MHTTILFDINVLSYPIVFAVVALPLSVVRWTTGFGGTPRHMPAATFVVEFIYGLSGTLNVVLILVTRSPLLLPRDTSRDRNRLGVAPSISLPKINRGSSEVSRPDSSILEMGARNKSVPLEPLPGEGDIGWHLPSSKRDSAESIY